MLSTLKSRGLSIFKSVLKTNCNDLNLCRTLGTVQEARLDVVERPRLVEMKYGEKKNHIFSDQEFATRISKLRSHMAKADIGACVFTSYHNINYYSGLMYCSMGRNYGLIVTHDECKTVTSAVDGGQPWRRGKADNLVYTDWYPDTFFHAIQTQLQDIGGKIGLEFDVLSVDSLTKLNTALPRALKTDIAQPTMQMRMVKSPEEIEVIRNGARIADIGGFAGVEAIAEGVPEYEVVLQAKTAMVREIAKTYPQSDIMDTWAWLQTGIDTDGAHNPATAKPIKNGEIMVLNVFPMMQGYFAALERTMFLKHVSDEHLWHWQVNCDVTRKGCELVRPGVRCCDVTEELNEIFMEKDLLQYRTIGYGHSFGSLSYYYGREAGLEFREYVTTVLEPGMVVSMEPMIVIPHGKPGAGGYREHDLLVVTEDGNENLTKFPLGPEHLILQK